MKESVKLRASTSRRLQLLHPERLFFWRCAFPLLNFIHRPSRIRLAPSRYGQEAPAWLLRILPLPLDTTVPSAANLRRRVNRCLRELQQLDRRNRIPVNPTRLSRFPRSRIQANPKRRRCTPPRWPVLRRLPRKWRGVIPCGPPRSPLHRPTPVCGLFLPVQAAFNPHVRNGPTTRIRKGAKNRRKPNGCFATLRRG